MVIRENEGGDYNVKYLYYVDPQKAHAAHNLIVNNTTSIIPISLNANEFYSVD